MTCLIGEPHGPLLHTWSVGNDCQSMDVFVLQHVHGLEDGRGDVKFIVV